MRTDIEILRQLMDLAVEYSGDRKTQVGAGFYLNDKLYWGVNQLAHALPEDEIVNRTAMFYNTMIHAEASLVARYVQLMRDSTVYVTLFPCDNCATLLIKAGVKKVIVLNDRPTASYIIKAKELFDEHGVEYSIIG